MNQYESNQFNDDMDVCLADLPESIAPEVREQISDLILTQVTMGLTEEEAAALNELCLSHNVDSSLIEALTESLELSAAAVEVSDFLGQEEEAYEEMPDAIYQQVLNAVNGFDFSVNMDDTQGAAIDSHLTDRGQLKLTSDVHSDQELEDSGKTQEAHPQQIREQIKSLSTSMNDPVVKPFTGWGWVTAAAIFIVSFAVSMSLLTKTNELDATKKQLLALNTVKDSLALLQDEKKQLLLDLDQVQQSLSKTRGQVDLQNEEIKDLATLLNQKTSQIAMLTKQIEAKRVLLTAAQQREKLLAEANDILKSEWAGLVNDYKTVQGDIVWSTNRQEGYMRLVGLPQNNPSERQYQLWIVDPSKGEKFNRIDGGVFNVDENGEVVIPVDAKIRSGKPAVFAITSEKPGGVVVSAGPLLAVAKVE